MNRARSHNAWMALWDHIDAALARRGERWADLGRRIGVSDQVLTNWKRRGIPASRYAALAEALSVTIDDLLAGRIGAAHPPDGGTQSGSRKQGGARVYELNPARTMMLPPQVAWERITVDGLPTRFLLEVRDDAMAPTLPAGHLAVFLRRDPRPGETVLAVDRDGGAHIRQYSLRRPGHWLAMATNPAFAPLDSLADGLQVVAVLIGHHWE